jgi:murein DD-endopeptidase MepM/ murein hydrolase activator NlpD
LKARVSTLFLVVALAGTGCSNTADMPARPVFHEVRQGDDLRSIAARYQTSFEAMAIANDLEAPYRLKPGQRLWITSPSSRAQSTAAPGTSGTARVIRAPDVYSPQVKPAVPAATTQSASSKPVSTATSRFAWPVEGRVVKRYGPDDVKKGIDIQGNVGQPVAAADDGEVVYAGSGIEGYGNLLIIKHRGDWISAYGNNRKLLVREGQNVTRGARIAEVGTDGAGRALLHFELRINGRSVDPLQYLPDR